MRIIKEIITIIGLAALVNCAGPQISERWAPCREGYLPIEISKKFTEKTPKNIYIFHCDRKCYVINRITQDNMWSDEKDFGKLLAGSASLEAYDLWNHLYRCITGENLPNKAMVKGTENREINGEEHLCGKASLAPQYLNIIKKSKKCKNGR